MLPNIPLERLDGSAENLNKYLGRVLLVVNVASHCGFTSQYYELQALYEELQKNGLEILAFPCNQFGAQEPGSAQQIQDFCTVRYGVTFPIFQKTDVNGPNAHPLFKYLEAALPGTIGTEAINWNFTKFLINRDGLPVKKFSSATTPDSIRTDIEQLL